MKGLRPKEKFDLLKMSLEMLKMQIQNDRRFYNNGMNAPSSYLWESHLSILGMMVCIIFPLKIKDFQKAVNNNQSEIIKTNKENDSKYITTKVLEILTKFGKNNSEMDLNEIIGEITKQGLDEIKVKTAIQNLINEGIVFTPRLGKIQIIH